MKHNIILPAAMIAIGLIALVFNADANVPGNSQNNYLADAPISKAAFSFEVAEIKQSGNTVSFIIPRSAHENDKKADAVQLSGLYAPDKHDAESCPVVDSHFVKKEVKSYNPLTGRAEVTATFDDASIAKKAASKGCLLIYDVD